jgi:hypothetical protein
MTQRIVLWGTGGGFDQFLKHQFKILLEDFRAKSRRSVLKATIVNEILSENVNDNGIWEVNFATSESIIIKSTVFPHK